MKRRGERDRDKERVGRGHRGSGWRSCPKSSLVSDSDSDSGLKCVCLFDFLARSVTRVTKEEGSRGAGGEGALHDGDLLNSHITYVQVQIVVIL